MSLRTIALFLVAAVYVVAIGRARWYVPPPTPNPPGSFAFAALGDAIVVTPGNAQPFAFHRSTVSWWKFW